MKRTLNTTIIFTVITLLFVLITVVGDTKFIREFLSFTYNLHLFALALLVLTLATILLKRIQPKANTPPRISLKVILLWLAYIVAYKLLGPRSESYYWSYLIVSFLIFGCVYALLRAKALSVQALYVPILCTNFLCSTTFNTGTGGQGSGNSGGVTQPPCTLPSEFTKGIFTTNNYGDNHPNWCTYNTLAFIKGGTPCSWAMLDGKTCAEDDTTGMSPDDLKPFFESKGNVNFEVGAYSACELLQRVQDGQRALLCIRKAAGGKNYHVYLYWWFYKDAAQTFDDILITCYDTEEGGRGFQVNPKDIIFGDINYMIY